LKKPREGRQGGPKGNNAQGEIEKTLSHFIWN